VFYTPLRVELDDDLGNDGSGEWRLLAPLVYESQAGVTYTVPTGFSCDFASVPRIPVIYALYGNRAHRPAVLHDYLLHSKEVTRRVADDLFYEAMLSVGMSERHANAMHLAVRSYSASLELEGPEGKGHEFI